jgi:hypothetical protein
MKKGLNQDQIKALYAGRRVKGLYEDRTIEFIESDELGVEPMDQWPLDFGDKSATTVFQGFRNAIKKGELTGVVDVMQRGGKVFICHRERCGIPAGVTVEDEN